ncbi:CoA pyrophosphatase [Tritonibacter scottomollicae]|uniref:8-oxo-dGTP pyrophosphatase MutT (NUDIX family) n=1 Tax=Tritonibacter scottomollicae TaxID=483013 RepID=A0A2T1AL81_TRISK|nr:CoA pyrophosphatase [Tritonibacter scottomollicae]PRZ49366.1 8-oxo-dGTP pyrophosphatase MutT (NUDIX family) [Tritonibacter scottomollicae]
MSALAAKITKALTRNPEATSDFDLNPGTVLPVERELRSAGVLIGIETFDTVPQVILTKRSSALKHHPGQIAFPGGKVDAGDRDVTDAALREAWEEIALPRDLPRILGQLPAHETVTGFQVTPVVALIERPFEVRAEVGEVAEVFRAPLAHVLDIERYQIQSRRWRKTRRHYFTVPFGPYYIWGATARMLRGFASMLDAT